MLKIFAAATLLNFALASVSATTDSPLPLRVLLKSAFSRIQKPMEKVIRSEDEWKKFWADASVNEPAKPLPKVDFSKEMVIVAALGRRNSGGFSIEITRVQKTDDKLKVFLKKRTPPKNSMAIQALTAPIHVVAAPSTSLAVEFIDAGTNP